MAGIVLAGLVLGASILGVPADTTVIVIDGDPVWGEAPALVEEVRIGALDGPAHLTFGRVGYIAVHASGVIAVADVQLPVVRLFDGDGNWLGDAGGQGEGPGEYQGIAGLQANAEGFEVWDPASARLTRYSVSGEYLSATRVESGLFTSNPLHVGDDGLSYVKASARTMTGPDESGEVWLVVGEEGEIAPPVSLPADNPEGPAFRVTGLEPFTVRTHTALDRSGKLVRARSDAYAVFWPTRSGDLLRLERAWTPTEVGGPERRMWESWASFFERGTPQRFDPIPRTKPVFHGLWIDAENRLWLRRYVEALAIDDPFPAVEGRPAFTWAEPLVHDVIDSEGTFWGRVELPYRSRVFEARGDNVWATVRGDFDEVYVVRYRIEQ